MNIWKIDRRGHILVLHSGQWFAAVMSVESVQAFTEALALGEVDYE